MIKTEKEKTMRKSRIWTLLITFLKIGAFTFGGGYAMIPLIQTEIVDKQKYINEDDFLDLITISQTTPGVIAVNTATFVGYKVAGILGALVATIGVVVPSFIMIVIISWFYTAFRNNFWVSAAFSGINAGVIILVFYAIVRLGKKIDRVPFTFAVMFLAFGLTTFTEINIIFILLGAGLAGVVWCGIFNKGLKVSA